MRKKSNPASLKENPTLRLNLRPAAVPKRPGQFTHRLRLGGCSIAAQRPKWAKSSPLTVRADRFQAILRCRKSRQRPGGIADSRVVGFERQHQIHGE